MAVAPYRPIRLPGVPVNVPGNMTEYLRALHQALDETVRGIYTDLAGINNPTDVTADRVVDTNYQNTTSRLKHVQIAVSTADGNNVAGLLIGTTAPPTIVAGRHGSGAASGAALQGTLTAEVPPGWYYRLSQVAGATTITSWLERNS